MILHNLPKHKEGWLREHLCRWANRSLDRAAVPAIVALVPLIAFGLGRLSAWDGLKSALVVHPPSQTASASFAAAKDLQAVAEPVPGLTAAEAPPQNPYAGGNPDGPHNFVASKNGTKYYPADCGGAKRISEANKIWFATVEEAKVAGYSAAANCKY